MKIKDNFKLSNRPKLVVLTERQYQLLQDRDELGKLWTLKEFKDNLGISKGENWIREYLLKPNRDEIEYGKPKGWCVFGDGRGHTYRIQPSGARRWLEENFNNINWNK